MKKNEQEGITGRELVLLFQVHYLEGVTEAVTSLIGWPFDMLNLSMKLEANFHYYSKFQFLENKKAKVAKVSVYFRMNLYFFQNLFRIYEEKIEPIKVENLYLLH